MKKNIAFWANVAFWTLGWIIAITLLIVDGVSFRLFSIFFILVIATVANIVTYRSTAPDDSGRLTP